MGISKAEAKTINGGTSLPSSFAFSFSFGTGGGFTFTLESGFNYLKKKNFFINQSTLRAIKFSSS
ncbi:hypothetical protein [Chishuiella sp.]|uniref:hypothetical protein n=1 Tax=Chishuiella sp. TaxID=1969467 RepID=UPI0028AEF113|nr:hypothetical protein [Chishuiella sp.]